VFSDVVMLETGAGLLLANHAGKSQLFSTRDDGATWRKVDSKGHTFSGLVSFREQLQPVVSVSRQYDFYHHAILDETLSRVLGEARVTRSNTPFAHPAAVPPDATTFMISGSRWVALRETSFEPSAWEFGVAPFGELPSYRAVEELAGCVLSVAATASAIAIACRHVASAKAKASLFPSDDEGRSFREFPLPPNPVALYALGDAFLVQTPCDGPVETRGPFLLAPPAWRLRQLPWMRAAYRSMPCPALFWSSSLSSLRCNQTNRPLLTTSSTRSASFHGTAAKSGALLMMPKKRS
jgi:hypothetical protein